MQDWKLEPARDLGLPLGQRLRSHRRESGLLESAAHQAWWGLVRGYLAVFHRLAVVGRENIPRQPPFVLVANHSSHLDTLVLAALMPWRIRDRVFPIAAGDTFFEKSLVTVFAAGVLNALPMWRRKSSTQALKQLRERLHEEPCAYILFPEGTRSRNGEIGRFKPGLGMLVAGSSVPVIPCHLDGTFRALPSHRKLPRLAKITLRVGEPLVFSEVNDDRGGWEEVARVTEAVVRRLRGKGDSGEPSGG